MCAGGRSRRRRAAAFAFVVAFALTLTVFVATELTYAAYLQRGDAAATVTDSRLVTDNGERLAEIQLEVTNPTGAPVELAGVSTAAAYVPGREDPIARVEDTVFHEARVEPGGTTRVELRLRPTDGLTPLREAIETEQLTVRGSLSARISGERFAVPISGAGSR